ncbi:hypothetical protein [Maricaulis sp.]|uniref:DUF6896 domain-containing protein n=1 Tax=Maricaulis sp. TaxID=1486257 RepID=UPI001B20B2C5|nr:hypothetical protein [Maricaulis sp.]MBO6798148.1 hypothetical protein [Maricaulis sp.]
MAVDIESCCRELVGFQLTLVRTWSETFGLDMVETASPGTGEIMAGNERWRYRRHGLGVDFVRLSDGVDVDIHDEFARPELFDLWRLELFLESRGVLIRQPLLEGLVMKISGVERIGRHYFFTCE